MATCANIVMDQGATFEFSFNLTDENGDAMDLSGYTANGQMRQNYTSSNSVSFTTNVNGSAIELTLTAEQTANIVSGRYRYDVEINDGSNNVTRVIEGDVTCTPEVTR